MRAGNRLLAPGAKVLNGRPVVGGGFVGVLDGISDVAAAYSLRKLRSAYAGDAVRVRRSSDDAEQDVGFDGSGDFDTSAFSAFVGGGTGYVVTWYDQSGGSYDAAQSITTDQPTVVLSAINSLASIASDGTNRYLDIPTSAFAGATSGTAIVVSEGRGVGVGFARNGGVFDLGTNSSFNHWGSDVESGSGNTQIYDDFFSTTRVLSAVPVYANVSYIYSAQSAASNRKAWLNGSVSYDSGSNVFAISSSPVVFDEIGYGFNGWLSDLIILSSLVSTSDHNTIGNDMATYYGLSWTTVT